MCSRSGLPTARRALVHTALALALAAGVAAQTPSYWLDVELPAGFHLDLSSGEVASIAPAEGERVVGYENGRLVAAPVLRAWPRTSAERVSTRLVRGGGVPARDPELAQGDELVFTLSADLDPMGERWGYLRVLAHDDTALRLELALDEPGSATLQREPSEVRALARGSRCELSWFPPQDEDAEFVVTRRTVLGPSGEGAFQHRELARVRGASWVDESLPKSTLVEYRVARVDRGPGFGARVRAVAVDHPADWPFELTQGMRLDLLTGAIGGSSAHLEVPYVQPPTLTVRPMGGARTLVTANKLGTDVDWVVPAGADGRYMEQLRSVSVQGTLVVALPAGLYARLLFEQEDDGRVVARRQFDLDGGRVFPLPPDPPQVQREESSLMFVFDPPPADAPEPDALAVVVERELAYHSDDWEEIAVAAPGVRHAEVPLAAVGPDDPPLARFRFRQRYASGAASFPGPPHEQLLVDAHDPAATVALVERAMADLVHSEFERRVLARGLLAALGEAAWPQLREALSSESLELAAAARDILLAADAAGGHLEVLLRARAAAEGVEGEPPPGLSDPDPRVRAFTLVHPGPGFEEWDDRGWARVVSEVDPDEATGRFAASLNGAESRVRAFGSVAGAAARPYALIPPGARRRPERGTWRFDLIEVGPLYLVPVLREAADLDRPEAALVFLTAMHLAAEFAEHHDAARWPAADASGRWGSEGPRGAIELALRLAERYEETGEDALLAAAERLLDEPGARLRALRDLAEGRLWNAGASGVQREVLTLEDGDLEHLEALVSSLAGTGTEYVDVVLAPGEWRFDAGATDQWVELTLPGLRLIGGPDVHLFGGLRVQDARDVVLEGLRVTSTQGAAVNVARSSVTIVDCELGGVQGAVTAQDGDLELVGSRLFDAQPERASAWSLRGSGRGVLLARECLIEGGTIMPGERGFLYLDRCVVDGGARTVIQGQRETSVVARDSLLRGTGAGIYNVASGYLHGVVIDVARDPLGRGVGGVRACPLTVHVLGGATLESGSLLPECELGGR